jgi:hypothetical protein
MITTFTAGPKVLTLTAERTDSLIVSTDEMLAEYLTFLRRLLGLRLIGLPGPAAARDTELCRLPKD